MGIVWVAIGGAIGAAARYGVVQWTVSRWGTSFPWGTLAVNVTGSMLIGFLAALLAGRATDPAIRLLLITGVLGGYTTFSAFSFETLSLLYEHRSPAAIAYVFASVVLSLAAAACGVALAMLFTR